MKISPVEIINAVCIYYEIPVEDLMTNARFYDIIKPKHIAIYLIRKYSNLSFRSIGILFNKDHSTSIHACNSVRNQIYLYKDYAEEIAEIEDRLFFGEEVEIFMENDFMI